MWHRSSKRERDESERHIWSTVKLCLPQDLTYKRLYQLTLLLLLIRQVAGEPHLQDAFHKNLLILNDLQCQDTAM